MGNLFDSPINRALNRTTDYNMSVNISIGTLSPAITHSSKDSGQDMALTIVLILLTVLILTGNGLSLFCLVAARFHRQPGLYFVLSLCLADLLVGLLCLYTAACQGRGFDSLPGCLLQIAVVVAVCATSILSILGIAFDRYLAILHPLEYPDKLTQPRALALVLLIWTTALLLGFLPTWFHHQDDYQGHCLFLLVLTEAYILCLFFACFLPPVLLFLYFYARILRVSYRHMRRISDQAAAVAPGSHHSFLQHLWRHPAQLLKPVRTLAVIICTFLLAWLPFFVTTLVQVVCGQACHLEEVTTYLILLAYSNSFINPYIYVFFNKEARQTLHRFLCCHRRGCCCSHSVNSTNVVIPSLYFN